MKYSTLLYPLAIALTILLVACQSEPVVEEGTQLSEDVAYVPNQEEVKYEEYIASVDGNDSLAAGNSLFYSKGEGEFAEVEFFVNDKNEMIKMIEYYTQESLTVAKNIFYFKEGRKFATKELFEHGAGETLGFTERVTYYGKDEQPIVTKMRKSAFEQDLEFETFQVSEKTDCSMERALQILNQEGEFNTTFQGFVKEDPFLYIVVGGDDPNAFCSSLIVQNKNRDILKLLENEQSMLGTPLVVDFQIVEDAGEGFEYQILNAVAIR